MIHIALLTDFGTRDPYVAAMKGVLASRCDAALADLTHEIAPFDVWEAAWFLRPVAPYWPEGTVFLAVVDPGVGTSRRILAAEENGRFFVAPDNGLLTFVAGERVIAVEDESIFLPDGSNTFHGRDRFAPVAAAIAGGQRIETLGRDARPIVRLDYTPPRYASDHAEGTIVRVDRFGNLITDIERARIGFGPHVDGVGGEARTYAEAPDGPFLITGSTGCIEISVRNGSAAAVLHLRRGGCVTVRPA
jgi:S-adenosylmethionine hydrolase